MGLMRVHHPLHRACCWLLVSISIGCAAGKSLSDSKIQFEDATKKAGLLKPLAGIMGHGGAWGDFDGDGYADLFVGGFCDRPNSEYVPSSGPVPSRLFRNDGKGRFELVTDKAVSFYARTSGAVFADLDNDGKPELYIANNARPRTRRDMEPQRTAQLAMSRLLKFNGKNWMDKTASSNALPEVLLSARNIGVFDYDKDGRLDLLMVEDRFVGKNGSHTTLLRNLGGLRFKSVNDDAGIPKNLFGLGHAVADINQDDRPDFFIGHSNRMFLSGSDGRYRESGKLNKTFEWNPLDGEDWPCGAAFGDLNNDGRLDLVVAIHSVKARNRVYLNMGMKDGEPVFKDVSEAVGLGDAVPVRTPHVELHDFDNDGRVDIYLSAGWRTKGGGVQPLIYHNEGNDAVGLPRFVSPRPIKEQTSKDMVYYPAGPSADYNRDGKLDLFLINWFAGDHCHLLKNTSAGGNWLKFKLKGNAKGNRMGIGARVTLTVGNDTRTRLVGTKELQVGYGYASGQESVLHVGLGKQQTVHVQVKWPSGKVSQLENVKANQLLTVEESR